MPDKKTRESMSFDIVIVGAGPAGLCAAIRLAQLNQENNQTLSICVIEKASAIGGHLLSGAVLEPRALNSLLPNWQDLSPPSMTEVTQERFVWLRSLGYSKLPQPKSLKNNGNYIISLGQLCQWLAQQAEQLGVALFPGFAAAELLFNEDNTQLIGIATGDKGLDKSGNPSERYQPGIALFAKQTLFAEGARGYLSQQLMSHFNLREHANPQTYGIGLKEVWHIDEQKCENGHIMHAVGWPLNKQTYGGSFLYQFDHNKVSVGLVVGLDYRNPYLDPFEELQQLKRHPLIRKKLEGGQCISYGARALNEGGWQSIPKLSFNGGLLIGCAAGFLNVAKIKGNHTAMYSGMLAAEAIFSQLDQLDAEITHYEPRLRTSWLAKELKAARNIRPAFNKGRCFGLGYSAVDQFILKGKMPWTFKNHADHLSLKNAKQSKKIQYPPADGRLTFRKLDQVFLTNTNHNDNQPCHLKLKDEKLAITVNLDHYDSPESFYCPAGVYEIVTDNQNKKLQINFQNCIHCKTCDIKDPTQNIVWTPPEGGDGPNYQEM